MSKIMTCITCLCRSTCRWR